MYSNLRYLIGEIFADMFIKQEGPSLSEILEDSVKDETHKVSEEKDVNVKRCNVVDVGGDWRD